MNGVDLKLIAALFERLDECPFFIKDAALTYVAANGAMARLCGTASSADLIGRTAAAFFPPADARRFEAFDAQVVSSGSPLIDKLDVAAGRGAATWLVFSRWPVRDAGGQVVGVAASARRLAEPERRHPVYARLAAAVALLEAAPEAPLALSALAARVGISPSQLERDFRHTLGTSPQRFLHRARIDRACVLLAQTLRVADIAQACGYADQSAFTRRFVQLVGQTPTAYRASMKR